MKLGRELKLFFLLCLGFAACYYFPAESPLFQKAFFESFVLVKEYAQEHVLTCLVPAFLIAGALIVFINQSFVLKHLGANAPKPVAYGVASVSGCILAVCSCTVLPLFSGIYRIGAGLGPASSFLYSGPAINVLAMIMTTRILGVELGVARSLGAIIFSVVIGLCMHLIFRKEEMNRVAQNVATPQSEESGHLGKTAAFFVPLVAILVFANFGAVDDPDSFWQTVYHAKWFLTALSVAVFFTVLGAWFGFVWWHLFLLYGGTILFGFVLPLSSYTTFVLGLIGFVVVLSLQKGTENSKWLGDTWGFAKQILPLLLGGVIVAGLLLGGPHSSGLIDSSWIQKAVGGNSLGANFFASIAGAFMYFATLTEVPILQGLLQGGMGKGPALALLLAGPALSLPNMIVIKSVLGFRKTLVFVGLVVIMATMTGIVYGKIMG